MEQLANFLQSTLSPHAGERQSAEANLEAALAQQGTAISLTQLSLSEELPTAVRQMSFCFSFALHCPMAHSIPERFFRANLHVCTQLASR